MMEWMIIAGLVGVSGYFVARRILSTLQGGKGGTCGEHCDSCVSCHLALRHDEKK